MTRPSLPTAHSREEVVLPFAVPRNRIVPTSKFKSTWVVSSQNALRTRGHWDRYLAALPSEHRQAIELTVVGGWLPISVAAAHYEACERLGLGKDEQIEMGREVSKHLDRSLLGTAAHVAHQAGMTVWTPLGQLHRLWDRMFVGGAAAVYKVGPKETRVEFAGCTLAHIPYFRTGLRGVLLRVGGAFTEKLYVTDLPSEFPNSIVFRGAWV